MELEEFSLLDSAGDARLRLRARGLPGLFRAALQGFTSLITDPAAVRAVDPVPIELKAPDREELLVAWLNELVYLLDTREFLPARVDIAAISEKFVEATVYGEPLNPKRHERRLLVKAATYHGLYIRETDEGLIGEITLDL